MSTRWMVERKSGEFEDVGAESMSVLDCGALKFYNGTIFYPTDIIYIAPGQWVTVVEESE